MRRFLPILFTGLFVFSVNGQVTSLKNPDKKAAGTTRHDLKFETVDGRKSLKFATSPGSKAPRSIAFQTAKNDRVVIRKGSRPIFIEEKITPLKSASSVTPEDRLFKFLEANKALTGIDNPRGTFKINEIRTDELGITHIRTIQHYKGIEVYGSESVFHLDPEKERFNGSFFTTDKEINVVPKIQFSRAVELTKSDLTGITTYKELSDKEKKLLNYNAPQCSLVLFNNSEGNYSLAWMISVRPNFIEEWQYVIDAADGSIIRKFNNTKSDGAVTGTAYDLNDISRTIDLYLEAGTYYMINVSEPMYNTATDEGLIMTLDANNTSTSNLDYSLISSTNNTWTAMKAAVSAHYNAYLAYEYFRTTFNRNSINGKGGNIISFINVTESDGSSMENAFWNGQAVFYGNGGTHFKSLSGAIDVTAHELGHGVISNSANLEYIGQSGAINESYADIFGSMVDREDWLMGEDVVKAAYYPTGALRDMRDPHNGGTKSNIYWQPAHFSEMYIGDQDNGGVHINSGIGNKAYYLFATAVTKEKAEKVFYRALTEYLTKTSQFIDFRIAVVQAAKDLYGAGSTEAAKAGEAFDAVGVYPDEPQTDEPEYNVNPGEEHLLFYFTDDEYTLCTWPLSDYYYYPLTNYSMKGKASVTDDGNTAVFVDLNDRINVINLNLSENPDVHAISEPFFDNVAISKDGKRLAAVSVEADTSIYVFDIGLQQWAQFTLYNPTTSDGNILAGGVLFADAIEFDHTGEYIIYDAYNELNSSSVEDISYWDVGIIKVWDNAENTFGDGTIMKLFTQLPENVSVGNPVFSKNSPNIIAFDYFFSDGFTEEYGIYGANLETGDLNLIYENNTLGYPTFSKDDSRIAFTTAVDQYEVDINYIELLDDKISPSGGPQFVMDYAKWPVYYAQGDRELGLAPVANFTADYKSGSAPLLVKFVDLSTNHPTSWAWTFQGGSPSSSTVPNPEITYNTPGTYRVTLKATNSTGENTINREGYIVVSAFTGTDKVKSPALLFFPNPAGNQLQITYNGDFNVRIYNQSGSLIISANNQPVIDLSRLNPGAYIIEIESDSAISRHKLIKQ